MELEDSHCSVWLARFLQTADPLFPTGAYAHSFGLEELVSLGVVFNEASLTAFLQDHLLPLLENQELPHLRFAFECAADLDALCAVDQEIHATKLAMESRDASTQIGIRRLSAFSVICESGTLSAYRQAVQEGKTPGHHVCACAIQGYLQGVPLGAALLGYGYQSLAGACTAALKLIRIGQDGVQRALSSAQGQLPETVRRSLTVARKDAGCFSPLLEIAAMRHAHANARLFIS